MKAIEIYKDKFENTAIIEQIKAKSYCDDFKRTMYRLICTANYENDFIYHVSVHRNLEEAQDLLKEFSCGTFELI